MKNKPIIFVLILAIFMSTSFVNAEELVSTDFSSQEIAAISSINSNEKINEITAASGNGLDTALLTVATVCLLGGIIVLTSAK